MEQIGEKQDALLAINAPRFDFDSGVQITIDDELAAYAYKLQYDSNFFKIAKFAQ